MSADSSMRERELKLVVDGEFVIPPLDTVIPGARLGPPEHRRIEDLYYDTDDLRLARWGVTLRWRSGSGWTVKIPRPTDAISTLDRDEIILDGPPGTPPEVAVALVASFARGAALRPVVDVANDRTARVWRRDDGTAVAEVVDDRVVAVVRAPEVRFRELEVELAPDQDADLLPAVLAALAVEEPGVAMPKLVRILGERATADPDVVVAELDEAPTGAQVIQAAIAASVTRLIHHLPAARLGRDPEGVHQARVATRRLRSDLRTFGPLLQADWARELRSELSRLADELGKVRDADVLLLTLGAARTRHPEIDPGAADALLRALAAQRDRARRTLLAHLDDEDSAALLARLVDASAAPRTRTKAQRPARETMPALVQKSWHRLREAVEDLGDEPVDEDLHRVRILAKRVRYAAEAVTPAVGKKAGKFAAAAASIQDSLGDLNDVAVANAWLEATARELGGTPAFVAGRLAQQLTVDSRGDRMAWLSAYERMRQTSGWLSLS